MLTWTNLLNSELLNLIRAVWDEKALYGIFLSSTMLEEKQRENANIAIQNTPQMRKGWRTICCYIARIAQQH